MPCSYNNDYSTWQKLLKYWTISHDMVVFDLVKKTRLFKVINRCILCCSFNISNYCFWYLAGCFRLRSQRSQNKVQTFWTFDMTFSDHVGRWLSSRFRFCRKDQVRREAFSKKIFKTKRFSVHKMVLNFSFGKQLSIWK